MLVLKWLAMCSSIPSGAEVLLFFQNLYTSPGNHHTCCSVGTGAISMGVKWPGHEADHLRPSCAKINSTCSFTSFPPYVFMAWCLMKHKDFFTFIFTSYPCLDPQKIISHYVFMTRILHNILFLWHMLHACLSHMYWFLPWSVSLLMPLWKTVDYV